jgi:hypothetical protein
MTKDNTQDLLITKFNSIDKKIQYKILGFLLDAVSDKDTLVDMLNNKKLYQSQKHFYEGDCITIELSASMYPSPDKNYYIDNGLVINDVYIRVQVAHINPVNGYIGLRIQTERNKEETVEVYVGHILDQENLAFV